ncbi:hypothetical protein [Phenylobacterium sp.]|uniref:hypothetical protein n=1 Tax=Phenylobacterium sp. TaxID=1871053 RepID=UPI002FDEA029
MKKTLLAGLAGLSIAFAAGAALAEGAKSVDSTPISELAADPAGKAALDKELPGLTEHPAYEQFKGMTLRQLQPMSGGVLTDEKLAAIQKDLDTAPASAPAQAPGPASK